MLFDYEALDNPEHWIKLVIYNSDWNYLLMTLAAADKPATGSWWNEEDSIMGRSRGMLPIRIGNKQTMFEEFLPVVI